MDAPFPLSTVDEYGIPPRAAIKGAAGDQKLRVDRGTAADVHRRQAQKNLR
jgi:hypothetical protein